MKKCSMPTFHQIYIFGDKTHSPRPGEFLGSPLNYTFLIPILLILATSIYDSIVIRIILSVILYSIFIWTLY